MTRRIILIDIGPSLRLLGHLPSVQVDSHYAAKLTARGGTAPYLYEVISGKLPEGLYLDPATGELIGYVRHGGTYPFVIQVTDAQGDHARRAFVLQIQVDPLVIIGHAPTPNYGDVYSYTYQAFGGELPLVFSISRGHVPSGLKLDPATAELHGTSDALGDFYWTVRVTDGAGNFAELDDYAHVRRYFTSQLYPVDINAAADAPLVSGHITALSLIFARQRHAWQQDDADSPLVAGHITQLALHNAYREYAHPQEDADAPLVAGHIAQLSLANVKRKYTWGQDAADAPLVSGHITQLTLKKSLIRHEWDQEDADSPVVSGHITQLELTHK
jgi:hypothetical protein